MAGKVIRLSNLARKPPTPPPEPEPVVAPAQTAKAARVSPVHRFVEQLREKDGVDYKTTAEVADLLGVSTQWVRKVQRGTVLPVPSMITMLGDVKVHLYTPEDVDAIRRYLVARQRVYANPGPNAQVESWGEVKKRREQSTQDADRQDERDRTEGGTGAER